MSIARRPEKNPKVRKDLNILRAVSLPLIKVLTDLENRRDAFFSIDIQVLTDLKRFLPLHPEPFSKRAATVKPMARFAGLAQQPKRHPASGLEDLHVYSTMDRKEP